MGYLLILWSITKIIRVKKGSMRALYLQGAENEWMLGEWEGLNTWGLLLGNHQILQKHPCQRSRILRKVKNTLIPDSREGVKRKIQTTTKRMRPLVLIWHARHLDTFHFFLAENAYAHVAQAPRQTARAHGEEKYFTLTSGLQWFFLFCFDTSS